MTDFAAVAATFWQTSLNRPAPLDDAMVMATGRTLAVRLPAALLDLLHVRNGGAVADAWDAHPAPPNSWARDHIPLDHLLGIGPPGAGTGGDLTLLDTPYLVREWDLSKGIVLISGHGHYWVVLDYRESGPHGQPSVAWIDVDAGDDITLAPDFRTFVEGLGPGARAPFREPGFE